MVASIDKIASPSQGVSYYERDGYYTKGDSAHREASAWAGRGAEELRLSGPVEPDAFKSILEGKVPGGRQLDRTDIDGNIQHRPGRDVTLSVPKSVSLMALVGGDERIVVAHDRGGGKDSRLDRGERRRDPDAGQGHRSDGPGRRSEDGGRNLPPPHIPQFRSPTPYPCGDREYGAGRGRAVEDHGGRRPLFGQDGDRSDLPRGVGGGSQGARIRDREDAPGPEVGDRGRIARGDRDVFDAASGDRGCDGRAQPREVGRQPAPCGAGGAHDAGAQARRGQGRASEKLGAPSHGTGVLRRTPAGQCKASGERTPSIGSVRGPGP